MKTNSSTRLSRREALAAFGLAAGVSALVSPVRGEKASNVTKKNPILGESGVHHAGIWTRDWERTLTFYQKGLGFTLKLSWGEPPQRAAYIDAGDGTCIEVGENLKFVAPPSSKFEEFPPYPIMHLCLRTSQMDAALEGAHSVGAKVLLDTGYFDWKTVTPTGPNVRRVRTVFLEGPSGEWIELLENAP